MAGDALKTTGDSIWEFVRGDMPARDFESLAGGDPSMEEHLGGDLYLEVVSCDFASGEETHRIRERLAEFQRARDPRRCACIEIANAAVVDMGEDGDRALRTIRRVAARGEPCWWLYLGRCDECGQSWLVAEESRQNDVYCMLRLDRATAEGIVGLGRWPARFDTYGSLLAAGREAGKSVRFADPVGDSSLAGTMEQLARESPGIGLERIAELLHLGVETAADIARKVVAEKGVDIDLDGQERGPK